MTALLSVNLNKVALLRNSREGDSPSVVRAAELVLAAGAQGITVHPRPDQRHIRPADVEQLASLLADRDDVEFNIEGNPSAGPRANGYPGFSQLIELARPAQATLVPDGDDQLTSDHGWDLMGDNAALNERIEQYHSLGARVSLFMDPDPAQIERAKALGADRIELYTGPFAELALSEGIDAAATLDCFGRYRDAARHAGDLGLGVNAGHDLDLHNLPLFSSIVELQEVSIGHALIKDALEMGFDRTVAAYLSALRN